MTNTITDGTLPSALLLAAHSLEAEGLRPFSFEALCVRAWRQNPRLCGMVGYRESYPDAHKTMAALSGKAGIVQREFLKKVAPKLYRLTDKGRNAVLALFGEPEPAPPNAIALPAHQSALLRFFLESPAVEKFDSGQKAAIDFRDASHFLGLSEHVTGDKVDVQLCAVGKTLEDLDNALDAGPTVLSNGREVSAGDLRVVSHCLDFCLGKFDRHLALLRGRRDWSPKKRNPSPAGKMVLPRANGQARK